MEKVKRKVRYYCEDTIYKGCNGKGVGIAVLDTGISLHPDLKHRITAWKDFVAEKEVPYDDSSHGTHVAGILSGEGIVSRGQNKGMAPGASLCVLKILDQNGRGTVSTFLKAVDWLVYQRKRYGIRIVNLSVGMPAREEKTELAMIAGVEELWDQGMVVVVSAGNEGPEKGTVCVPGSSKKVITVGAMENGVHSGQGPTQECVVKPDLCAPGIQILSCNGFYPFQPPAYVKKSGTSMATPVVAGAAALLLQKQPEIGNVEMKLRLRECRQNLRQKDGYGALDVTNLLLSRKFT